ncbi:unnamed protein product [Protopolystoma xenopodis]|uniref:Uncharacterized protein n=1 Tax=Protopolystoma xenopodis TaxID=117903 RepID=A0A448WH53_9PLAT|nr:unnamed protein product [Protopolystoma xenopodis]
MDDADLFREAGQSMVDLLIAYTEELRSKRMSVLPAAEVRPGHLLAQLPEEPPETAEDFSSITHDIWNKIFPTLWLCSERCIALVLMSLKVDSLVTLEPELLTAADEISSQDVAQFSYVIKRPIHHLCSSTANPRKAKTTLTNHCPAVNSGCAPELYKSSQCPAALVNDRIHSPSCPCIHLPKEVRVEIPSVVQIFAHRYCP